MLRDTPDLPQAAQLARLAEKRGAAELPYVPAENRLRWAGSSPIRARAKSIAGDPFGQQLSVTIPPLSDADDPIGAEMALNAVVGNLSPDARTEWQQRVAWSYYIENRDADALRLARLAQTGTGEWRAHADWTAGLAAWRLKDCRYSAYSFDKVGLGTSDQELKAAGLYWAARAYTACGEPHLVQSKLRAAARIDETFYGILARERLGVANVIAAPPPPSVATPRFASQRNVKLAADLARLGEDQHASDIIRHQAKIGPASDHAQLIALADQLDLPSTQIYLAHNAPAGAQPDDFARYPTPNWRPERGWRVDPALVYAHALQESGFRREVVSPAGAFGLMQVRPGTARDLANDRGIGFATSDLARPSINLEYGQSYLEMLRASPVTGGLLPKVIAAYNAGPTPVARWNTEVRAGNDPLLYIESLPYWETRGYIGIILRNYWMYQAQLRQPAPTRVVLAQNQWPRFPDAPVTPR